MIVIGHNDRLTIAKLGAKTIDKFDYCCFEVFVICWNVFDSLFFRYFIAVGKYFIFLNLKEISVGNPENDDFEECFIFRFDRFN